MIDDMKKDVPNIGFMNCREKAREIDNDAVLRLTLGHIRIHYKHCLVKSLYRK
ncbi:Uncharacterized protein APZ42_024591 [Daphnia magna]|uniref:Uncharacterized protein n=1 Tax=Daphnia magna TaxID=35525 RepID=A0A164TZV9_9CRUS|nr:Uncharacterized protein APZ42_024591 [Daphnia magna]